MIIGEVAFPLSLFEAPPKTGDIIVKPIEWGLARRTVLKYHYSHRMPNGNLRMYGVWERDVEYVGTVIFGDGATPEIGKPYGLEQSQIVELVRIAMTTHNTPITQAVATALRDLKVMEPYLRLVISFADERQGHLGKIYQAGNWLYTGTSNKFAYIVNGEEVQPRTLHHRYGTGGQSIPWLRENVDPDAHVFALPPKHRYLYPLDKAMRRLVNKMALPYPRGLSVDGDTSIPPIEDASSTLADRSLEVVQ